eukprot:403370398
MVESIQKASQSFSNRMIGKISLAPMVRIVRYIFSITALQNSLPFRLMAKNYGADYVFSEEIIDRKFQACTRYFNEELNCIDYVSTRDYSIVFRVREEEKNQLILQIGTNNAETAINAVETCQLDICGVDVNMGCPKKFSTGGGMGSALMRDLQNAKHIMKSLVDRFGEQMSVSCKIRVFEDHEKTMEYVLAMQEAGVHWISIHPRTAAEECRVAARWYEIKQIIDTGLIKIPILGSGDMLSPLDVNKFLKFTGAQGAILARGAIHNPAIFQLNQQMVDPNAINEDFECWQDNTLPEIKQAVVIDQKETQDNSKQTKKQKQKPKNDDENVEFSQNLVRVFEQRYHKHPMQLNILDLVKEYFKICIETGNNFQNSKYNILYILKTHKEHYELFKRLQLGRNFTQYAEIFEITEEVKDQIELRQKHFDGQFYRKNKHVIDDQVIKTIEIKANIQANQRQNSQKVDNNPTNQLNEDITVGQKRQQDVNMESIYSDIQDEQSLKRQKA